MVCHLTEVPHLPHIIEVPHSTPPPPLPSSHLPLPPAPPSSHLSTPFTPPHRGALTQVKGVLSLGGEKKRRSLPTWPSHLILPQIYRSGQCVYTVFMEMYKPSITASKHGSGPPYTLHQTHLYVAERYY